MLKKSLIDSLNFFVSNWVALALIVLPVFGVIEILYMGYESRVMSEESGFVDELPYILVYCAAYPVVRAALVLFIHKQVSGGEPSVGECINFGLDNWFPFFVLTMILLVTVLTGFVLFIIPGIFLMVRYSFVEFNFLLERSEIMESFQFSWHETKKYFGLLLSGYLLITVCLYTPYILSLYAIEGETVSDTTLELFIDLVYFVLETIYLIFAYRVYTELKGSQK